VRTKDHSFRFGKEIISARPDQFASVLAAIINSQEAHLGRPSIPIANHLNRELAAEGWKKSANGHPVFSFFKSRVSIETEFSSPKFIYRDLIYFLSAYNVDKIDVGVLIVTTRNGMKRIKQDSSSICFEQVCEELNWLRPILPVPMWIVGLE
jgi:hypothetical protein